MGMHIPEMVAMQAHPITVTVTGIGLAVDQFFISQFKAARDFLTTFSDFWVGIIMTSCFLHF
jgi:hypothetical protein